MDADCYVMYDNRFSDQVDTYDGWIISCETRNIAGQLVMNIQAFWPLQPQQTDGVSKESSILCCHTFEHQTCWNASAAVSQQPRDGHARTEGRSYSCPRCPTEYFMCVASQCWLKNGGVSPHVSNLVRKEHFFFLCRWVDFGEVRGDTDLFEWNCLTWPRSVSGYDWEERGLLPPSKRWDSGVPV